MPRHELYGYELSRSAKDLPGGITRTCVCFEVFECRRGAALRCFLATNFARDSKQGGRWDEQLRPPVQKTVSS